MSEEKKEIHCLHICGHLDAMMEEAANKKFEERKQAVKPPIPCDTSEDSGQLHELYKDRVLRTEPSEEKKKMMRDLMESIESAKLAHSLMLLHAKEEEIGVKRHPSTLSHMHHDDSDSEGEVEDVEPMNDTTSGTTADEEAHAPAGDDVQDYDSVTPDQLTDVQESSKTATDDTEFIEAPTVVVESATAAEEGQPKECGDDDTHE